MPTYRNDFKHEVLTYLIETRSIKITQKKYNWLALNTIKKWKNEYEKKNQATITLSHEHDSANIPVPTNGKTNPKLLEPPVKGYDLSGKTEEVKFAALVRIKELLLTERDLTTVTDCLKSLYKLEVGDDSQPKGSSIMDTVVNALTQININNGTESNNPFGDQQEQPDNKA